MVSLKVDVSKTESTFGFRHIPFEDQVKSVVSQFLEVAQASQTE